MQRVLCMHVNQRTERDCDCNTLQLTAAPCNTLQRAATHGTMRRPHRTTVKAVGVGTGALLATVLLAVGYSREDMLLAQPMASEQDTVRGMQFKPGDSFGRAYELPADRLQSYPGGVAWHRNKGWSFATPDSFAAPKNFPGALSKVSAALTSTMDSLESVASGDDASKDAADTNKHSTKIFSAWTPWSVPDISDEDYKRDVMRGVLKKHSGFPDLPDCPTEGLWGSYRAGYAPGQKQGAGNCQDYSLRSTGVPAGDLAPKLGFNVKSWDSLWKEDLKGLKKARSYSKLTKGLWSNTAPDAAMAYYMPNSYKGSLAEYYQEPRGERTATENNAHDNSIVPVPGHKGPYYSSDFTRGEALDAPPPVAGVYGNRAGTLDNNNMAPLVQGLYSGTHLSGKSVRHRAHSHRSGGEGQHRLGAEEQTVADSLRSLNQRERRRLAATRGILLKAPAAAPTTSLSASITSPSSVHAARGRHESTYNPLSKTTTSALTQAYTGLLYPQPRTRVAVFGQPDDDSGVEDDQESKAQSAVKRFRRLRKKFEHLKSWHTIGFTV